MELALKLSRIFENIDVSGLKERSDTSGWRRDVSHGLKPVGILLGLRPSVAAVPPASVTKT